MLAENISRIGVTVDVVKLDDACGNGFPDLMIGQGIMPLVKLGVGNEAELTTVSLSPNIIPDPLMGIPR